MDSIEKVRVSYKCGCGATLRDRIFDGGGGEGRCPRCGAVYAARPGLVCVGASNSAVIKTDVKIGDEAVSELV